MSKRNNQTSYKPFASQNVSFTSSSASATAINAHIDVVRLVATKACYVTFDGSTPSSSTAMKLVEGVPEYFSVDGGNVIKVIRDAEDGSLNITQMDQ